MYALHTSTLKDVITHLNAGKYEIPALQRPFVWEPKQVLHLVQSAYEGIPLGTLCIWEKDDIMLYDGTRSNGWLVIDGQQRLSAIRSALMGLPILNNGNKPKIISVAFNPIREEFNLKPPMQNRTEWVPDIAPLFTREKRNIVNAYLEQPWLDAALKEQVGDNFDKLTEIVSNKIGVFEIPKDMPHTHVNEVFRHVNQSPTPVENIQICRAELQTYHPHLAETLTRFCLELSSPEKAERRRETGDEHPLYNVLDWMPTCSEALQEFAFKPGTSDVMKVLVWRIFNRGDNEYAIGKLSANEIRGDLEEAIRQIVSKKHFTEFNAMMHEMQMFTGQNQGNIAYWLFLKHRATEHPMDLNELRIVIWRWLLTTNLQGVQRGTPDVQKSIKEFHESGDNPHAGIDELARFATKDFFEVELPLRLRTKAATTTSRSWQVWHAIQAIEGDSALFHTDAVIDSPENTEKRELHHLYPKKTLTQENVATEKQNVVANRVITTESRNKEMGIAKFYDYVNSCFGNDLVYAIEQMEAHCIPDNTGVMPYEEFLKERACRMAAKIRDVYEKLKPRD